MLYSELLLPHNFHSRAKHIPIFSQRPFHLIVFIGPLFIVTRQTQCHEAPVAAPVKYKMCLIMEEILFVYFLTFFDCPMK